MTEFLKRTIHYITIQGGTNLILADLLANQNAPTTRELIITLPAGQTIGGTVTNGYAFQTGDLSGFGDITLIINGRLEGKGGAANSGNGSHAFRATSAITLLGSGVIYGGGGGGGKGGTGAHGEWVKPWTPGVSGTTDYICYPSACYNINDGSYEAHWNDVEIGYFCSKTYLYNPPYYYAENGPHNIAPFREIKRSTLVSGVQGQGGNGGVGRGYNQTNTAGADGTIGTNYAGNGGKGNWGSSWGVAGLKGLIGNSGKRFEYHAPNDQYGGVATSHVTDTFGRTDGANGGAAGYAIVGNSLIDRSGFTGSILGGIS